MVKGIFITEKELVSIKEHLDLIKEETDSTIINADNLIEVARSMRSIRYTLKVIEEKLDL